MNAPFDPIQASLERELSVALAVPLESAQAQLARQRIEARRTLDDAEATIAALIGRRLEIQEKAKSARLKALADHKADEEATLARDAAAVERLKDALVKAEEIFAENVTAYREGRKAIETDHANDLAINLRAIDDEEEAARLLKSAAEGMCAALAKVAA